MRGMHGTANRLGNGARRSDDFTVELARLIVGVKRIERRQDSGTAPSRSSFDDQ
jgi:hypothetical protein